MKTLPRFGQLSRFRWILVVLPLCFLTLLATKSIPRSDFFRKYQAGRFSKVLTLQKKSLTESVAVILEDIRGEDSEKLWDTILQLSRENPSNAFFVWEGDSLTHWTHNTFSIPDPGEVKSNTFTFIRPVWGITEVQRIDRWTVIGISIVKWVYPYRNQYLENHFSKPYSLPSTVKVSTTASDESIRVSTLDDSASFYLIFDQTVKFPLLEETLPTIGHVILFILLLCVPFFLSKERIFKQHPKFCLIFWSIFILIVRFSLQNLKIPFSLYSGEWFSPEFMSVPNFAPSLGDLLLTVLTIVSILLCIRIFWPLKISDNPARTSENFITPGSLLSLLAITVAFVLVRVISRSIVMNSLLFTYSKSFFDNLATNFATVFSLSMLQFAYIMVVVKLAEYMKGFVPFKLLCLLLGIISAFILLSGLVFEQHLLPGSALAFLLTSIILCAIRYFKDIARYVESLILTLILAAYTSSIIIIYERQRLDKELYVQAMDLAYERDDIAEYLLIGITNNFKNDTTLREMVYSGEDVSAINEYLKTTYFLGYLDKYQIHAVLSEAETGSSPVYSHYQNLVTSIGNRIENSSFYFLDDKNGLVNYLGWFYFSQKPRHLFVEMTSKYNTAGSGYPSLLLENSKRSSYNLERYSYAKYYDGVLTETFGDYPYRHSSDSYGDIPVERFFQISADGYIHTCFRTSDGILSIISVEKVSILSHIAAFSFIFLLYSVLATFVYFTMSRKRLFQTIALTFQTKIQFCMLLLLSVFVLISSLVTFRFMYQQSVDKNRAVITQILQAVSTKLNSYMEEYGTDDNPLSGVREFLFTESSVYSSDLNYYDTSGNLSSSSREEVFDKSLLSSKIKPDILRRIMKDGETLIIGQEQIGNLEYSSAYIPVIGSDNKIAGILNIPFFTEQNALTRDFSTLVMMIVNLFVVLFLISIIISVIISHQLTLPLTTLKQYLGKVQISTKAEYLEYQGKDEIGDLVVAYNLMARQLADNVEKLAKSERESAWREMARQIAHEIKNPLTPLRLNIQHIQRTRLSDPEKFDKTFDSTAQNLIHQIDILSDIASQFSQFASFTSANNENVDVVSVMENVIILLTGENVRFIKEYSPQEKILIRSDNNRINQVFTNIITNGIQAVPPDREPVLTIRIRCHDRHVQISINDNGSGIPEDMRDKIFVPNFTTKGSGMGLGLAIVKGIVESAGGQISFKTEPGVGTTFILEFPLLERDSE